MFARLMLTICSLVALGSFVEANQPCPTYQRPVNFCAVAQKAIPAVVYLKITLESGTSSDYYSADDPFGFFNDDLFERYFGKRPSRPAEPQEAAARGSGFLVSSDGYILTNNHVIRDAKKIVVVLNNGKEYPATVVGTDPHSDIGVVKIEGTNLPYLEFGNSDDVLIGEWVAAIGNPFELEASLTVGVISGKGRHNLRITDFDDFIQTDAAINPGNSGGPLLNLDGKVIGVATAILTRPGSGGYMGIGLAVPSNMAQHVFEQLQARGMVSRGYLGVYMQPLDHELSEALGLKNCHGALIADVIPGSPAAEAGLQQGDVITGFNDKPVVSMGSFRSQVALMTPGSKLKLQVQRDGKEHKFDITLTEHKAMLPPKNLLSSLGLTLRDISARERQYCPSGGVVIARVEPGSKAAKAGLKAGMVIQQVQRQPVHTEEEVLQALSNLGDQRSVLLVATDGHQAMLFALKLD